MEMNGMMKHAAKSTMQYARCNQDEQQMLLSQQQQNLLKQQAQVTVDF